MIRSPSDPATPLVVAPATPSDSEAVARLWERAGLTTASNDPREDFAFAADKMNSEVLVGRYGGAIVASVMVGHDGHRGWLYYVAVDPDHRKRRYGAVIVAAGERWLAERNVRKVMLLVRDTNTAVVDFYERLGFEAAPRVVMQKWLEPKA